jgi:hypothetical protein
MILLIFDTSTKRDYYRDVHNIAALPVGATIRYDYHTNHFSGAALAALKDGKASGASVLFVYAQTKSYRKGGSDPKGAIERDNGLWVAVRTGVLRRARLIADRYYLDLEMREYPKHDETTLASILEDAISRKEVPFEKWIALSARDGEYSALKAGDPATNWAAVVDLLGNFPSQFAGDTFWRVANVSEGSSREPIAAKLEDDPSTPAEAKGLVAFFPASELGLLGFEIQSRMPGADEEPKGAEPATRRKVRFEAAAGSPLSGFHDKEFDIRRYATEWLDAEVVGSDRVDAQACDLKLKTAPESNGYPIGPELTLKFVVSKKGWRSYWSILTAIASAIALVVGGTLMKDNTVAGGIVLAVGILLGIVAYYLWTGRVRLPGNK